jgi:hypothetical protein
MNLEQEKIEYENIKAKIGRFYIAFVALVATT